MRHTVKAVCLISAFTLTACDSPDLLAPSDVTGTYVLLSISDPPGSVPTTGVLHLRPGGQIERRLTFEGTKDSNELVTFGRYRVRETVLEIGFWADGGEDGQLYYRPVAYQTDYIMLIWGQPADGPDTIEVYQRITVFAE